MAIFAARFGTCYRKRILIIDHIKTGLLQKSQQICFLFLIFFTMCAVAAASGASPGLAFDDADNGDDHRRGNNAEQNITYCIHIIVNKTPTA